MKIATLAVVAASILAFSIPSLAQAGMMRHHSNHMMMRGHHTHMMHGMTGTRGKMAAHRNF